MNAGRHKRMILFLLAGSAAVILAAAFSVLYGSTGIPVNQVFGAIVHPDMENRQHIIIRELRIPRTLGCMLVGAAFSSAGAIMQGVTRNPLADSGLWGSMPAHPLLWRFVLLFCRASDLRVWYAFPFWALRPPW